MSKKVVLNTSLLLMSACFLTVPGRLAAHHGTAAFDTGQMVTVTGNVVEFIYMNPHVQLYFQVKNKAGEMEKWQGELTAPNKLNRAGWSKRTLKPGDSVTIGGYPERDNPHTLWIRKVVGPDGASLAVAEE